MLLTEILLDTVIKQNIIGLKHVMCTCVRCC